MKNPGQAEQPSVAAISVCANEQRHAFLVVDALDELETHLGAYRAIEQLATNEQQASEQHLPQLRRADLAALLSVLNTDLAAQCAKTRDAAVISATRQPHGKSGPRVPWGRFKPLP